MVLRASYRFRSILFRRGEENRSGFPGFFIYGQKCIAAIILIRPPTNVFECGVSPALLFQIVVDPVFYVAEHFPAWQLAVPVKESHVQNIAGDLSGVVEIIDHIVFRSRRFLWE